MLMSRSNRLFVQMHRIRVSSLDAGDLGQQQRVLVAEGRGVGVRPLAQLLAVCGEKLAPRCLLDGGTCLEQRRYRERRVMEVVEQLDLGGCNQEERLRLA